MGITPYGKQHILISLGQAIDSADIMGTGDICIKHCPVHMSKAQLGCVLLIVDIAADMAADAGVVDEQTQFLGYKLLCGSDVLYLGELHKQTKPSGAGLLLKIKLTDGDIHE